MLSTSPHSEVWLGVLIIAGSISVISGISLYHFPWWFKTRVAAHQSHCPSEDLRGALVNESWHHLEKTPNAPLVLSWSPICEAGDYSAPETASVSRMPLTSRKFIFLVHLRLFQTKSNQNCLTSSHQHELFNCYENTETLSKNISPHIRKFIFNKAFMD
jgi:hypothetical protein